MLTITSMSAYFGSQPSTLFAFARLPTRTAGSPALRCTGVTEMCIRDSYYNLSAGARRSRRGRTAVRRAALCVGHTVRNASVMPADVHKLRAQFGRCQTSCNDSRNGSSLRGLSLIHISRAPSGSISPWAPTLILQMSHGLPQDVHPTVGLWERSTAWITP